MRGLCLLGVLCAAGCSDRALGVPDGSLVSDLSVARDASAPRDLSSPRDLSEPPYDGPKRHLGEPCTWNAECLSGDCITPEESGGKIDHWCGARCEPPLACSEGRCATYDEAHRWCLPSCAPGERNSDCPGDFVCCSSGNDVSLCVSPSATVCQPR